MAPVPADSMMSSSDSPSTQATLSARYEDSSISAPATQHFSLPISAPIPSVGSGSVKAKSAYLCELRASTKQLQEEINMLLTRKMEEDKLRVMTSEGGGQGKEARAKTADEFEEEKYGEEGVPDEEEG